MLSDVSDLMLRGVGDSMLSDVGDLMLSDIGGFHGTKSRVKVDEESATVTVFGVSSA